jgi:hypothetical protein
LKLGDIDDVFAYVGRVARDVVSPADRYGYEEAVNIGLEYLVQEWRKNPVSLKAAISWKLEKRIRDGMRKEWKAPAPVEAEITLSPEFSDFEERIESLQALEMFQSIDDLRNPRLVGRYLYGTPSHRPVSTGGAPDVMDAILTERTFLL